MKSGIFGLKYILIITIIYLTFAPLTFADAIKIEKAHVSDKSILIKGNTNIPYDTSNYIQYYVGKKYEGTISCCILCDGITVNKNGEFSLEIPFDKLRGQGRYEVVLEQNPKGNSILPPESWIAFRKVDGKIKFGDITSMGEISNLALTVGMEICKAEFVVGKDLQPVSRIEIKSATHVDDQIVIRGISSVDRKKSTYIQYYVGKLYPDTVSNCILADGFHVSDNGTFELIIPVSSLMGKGSYEIALEQNPESNNILAPEHWVAFRKTGEGIRFGDISSMGEISNLALTVGMELTRTTFTVN